MTKGEREVAKTRADAFYGLKQGAFVVLADGKDKKVQFKVPKIERQLPSPDRNLEDELQENFERIYREARELF